MAIKKIFVLFLLVLLLFTFAFSCFGAGYYIPTDEEYQILMNNVFFLTTYSYVDYPSLSCDAFSINDFNLPSVDSNQVYLCYSNSNGLLFCYPVRFSTFSYQGFSGYLFGVRPDLYNEEFFLSPGYDMGLAFIFNEELIFPSLFCDNSLINESGTVGLSYLPRNKDGFNISVKNCLDFIVSGLGNLISGFLSPNGILFPLMQLLLLGISITFLLFAVKIIRRFIWGD